MAFKDIVQELTSTIQIYLTCSKKCDISVSSELRSALEVADDLNNLPECTKLNLTKDKYGYWKLMKNKDDETYHLRITDCPFWGTNRYKRICLPRLLCKRQVNKFMQLLEYKYNVTLIN